MRETDFIKSILEVTVDHAIRDIEVDAPRSIRKLIDKGADFSNGSFQKYFFDIAGELTADQEDDGPCYQAIQHLVQTTSHRKIRNFGINLGYQSCLKGAEIIRTASPELKDKIPWHITFLQGPSGTSMPAEQISNVITQVMPLGIYAYQIFCNANNLEEIALLCRRYSSCAFILHYDAPFLPSESLSSLQSIDNILLSVPLSSIRQSTFFRELRDNRLLFACHIYYTQQQKSKILSDQYTFEMANAGCSFGIFIPNKNCTDGTRKEVYEYIKQTRKKQQHPIFLFDAVSDDLEINEIISGNPNRLTIDPLGQVGSIWGQTHDPSFNITTTPLMKILMSMVRSSCWNK